MISLCSHDLDQATIGSFVQLPIASDSVFSN